MMNELNVQRECTTIVKWKLSNFSAIAARDDPKKELASDDFQLDLSVIKCYLSFEPTSIEGTDKNYSSLYLHVKDFADQSSIKVRFDLWIENENREKIEECGTHLLKLF
jgi:hypothetical protein